MHACVRTVLGATLLLAGLLKLGGPVGQLGGDGLTESPGVVAVLALAEFSLGLCLLCGAFSAPAWRLSLFCFAAFSGVALYKSAAGVASCGCFSSVPTAPAGTLAFDVCAVAALLVWRPRGLRLCAGAGAEGVGVILLACFSCGLLFAMEERQWTAPAVDAGGRAGAGEKPVFLEPGGWVGSPLPLMEHIDIGPRLAEGQWIVILYHHDCPSCRKAVKSYVRRAEATRDDRSSTQFALIEVPPYAAPGEGPAPHVSRCITGNLDSSKRWVVRTPTVIHLEGSLVKAVDDG
ncbi:MAG: MauE/DoxX family redox-associated membrane protein [Isosphaeraceae bacterium]